MRSMPQDISGPVYQRSRLSTMQKAPLKTGFSALWSIQTLNLIISAPWISALARASLTYLVTLVLSASNLSQEYAGVCE
jgi:hypothetical protein